MLRKHGVRGCSISLHRLSPSLTGKKKKLVEKSSKKLSVRFNVPWLPTVSTMVGDSPASSVTKKSNEDDAIASSSKLPLEKGK